MEYTHAKLILTMCERFGKLPDEIYEADAELLRLMSIVEMGTPEKEPDPLPEIGV